MADIGMTQQYWGQLMARYVKDPRNRIRQNSRDMSSARGNLAKELTREDMTWAVFLKGLRFLNPKQVKLKVEVTWQTGNTRNYDIIVHSGKDEIEIPEEEIETPKIHDATLQLERFVSDIRGNDLQ